MPFDTVFLINRFVEATSQAVSSAGGLPNQFVGDGILALFGLDADPTTACRQALRAASAVASNVAYLNHQFATEVVEPIPTALVSMPEWLLSAMSAFAVTPCSRRWAIGQRRLAAARPDQGVDCKVVVSEEVCKTAGLAGNALTRRDVAIRGHDGAMAVRTAVDPTVLASLVDPVAESDEPLPTAVAAE